MKTVTGWIAKDHYKKLIKNPWYKQSGILRDFDMFQKRDKKSFWCEKSWPPVKVKITIEEIEPESRPRGIK